MIATLQAPLPLEPLGYQAGVIHLVSNSHPLHRPS
jgi:hypothetical protein